MDVPYSRETSSLRHSFAYLVRQADAAVRIKYGVLFEEFVYNLFGTYCLPVILWRHGFIGAHNRSYWENSLTMKLQFVFASALIAAHVVFIMYNDSPHFFFGAFELVLLDIFAVMRAFTIAVKYSTYSFAELRELDHRVISREERGEKLILRGWTNPQDHLLYVEMERAIVRSCPHLAKHEMVFPDEQTRTAVLYQLASSLHMFVKFEICSDRDPTFAKHHDSATCEMCQKFTTSDPVKAFLEQIDRMRLHKGTASVAASNLPPISENAFDPAASAASCPSDVEAAEPRRASVCRMRIGTAKDVRKLRQSHHSMADSLADVEEDQALVHTYMKAHIPLPDLPTLPAKLFLWHTISTAAKQSRPLIRPFFVLSWSVSIVITFLPIVVRAIAGELVDMSIPGAVCNAVLILCNLFNVMTTLSFLFVGVFDHTRRLNAANLLKQLLDATALIALRMHDDNDMCDEENADAADGPDDVEQSEPPSPVQPSVRSPDTSSVKSPETTRSLTSHKSRHRNEFAHMDLYPEADDQEYSSALNAPKPPVGLGGILTLAKHPAQAFFSKPKVAPHSNPDSTVISMPARDGAEFNCESMDSTTPNVSRRVRTSMIARHQYLNSEELRTEVTEASTKLVSLPLMYPQNILAWSHMRYAALDLGRSYYYRIMIFTAFFAVFVAATVIFLFFLLSQAIKLDAEMYIVLCCACLAQLSLGLAVTAQVVQGSRVNRATTEHQWQLNHIESLSYEYLVTARHALPAAVRDRLLQVKKIASSVIEGVLVEDRLRPARVMGVPASIALLGTLASVTLSGVLATYQNFSR